MICTDPSWILIYATRTVLVVAGILVVILMQKAEHDKSIKRVDSKWLRNARRISFIAIAGCDGVFMVTLNPWALVMLFSTTTALLAVDIVALQHRPPANGHMAHDTSFGRTSAIFARLASHFNRHGR
jgi:hypothetical protein